MIFKHPDGRKTTIPHHSGEEIGPGLLTKIIKKDLGITREEFISACKKKDFGLAPGLRSFTKEDRTRSKYED